MTEIGGRALSLEDFSKIIFEESKVELESKALEKVDKNLNF
jgi:histidine ammonia-lyase